MKLRQGQARGCNPLTFFFATFSILPDGVCQRAFWVGVLLLATCGVGFRADSAPTLVPPPREVQWSAGAPLVLQPEAVAIVLGEQATEPEQYAATVLQAFVARRFGRPWPIVREGTETPAQRTLVILGQRTTCRRLDELCRQHGWELSAESPGHDGYVIHWVRHAGRLLICVGGSNARAVAYGQDTLSQMFQRAGADVTFVPGTVRDAPVIPWRGRPQTQVAHYLRPGELDLYVLSRVNFMDLRSGIYAFDPGEPLNAAEIGEAIRQAHRRGIIVYATVNCGVPRAEYDKALTTFRELLDLGADGLWLSFDDRGPGEDPETLVNRVLALGRERNIAGHLIAITPPKGSYQKITTEFNRKIMKIPGMAEALWFWTGVPSRERWEEACGLGLRVRPSWWHNWPRLATPQAYVGVPPLSLGWSKPDYEVLAGGGEYLEAVMPWGGNAFGQHYIVPVINWWGWNPQRHDWAALRQRIYSIVFGPDQAAVALQFDDRLHALFGLFRYAYKSTDDTPFCPPRLRDATQAQTARAWTAELATWLDTLKRRAPGQTLLPETELQSAYLNRMEQEVDTHRRAADLAYPEDWWPDYQRKILEALYAGELARVDELAAAVRARVLSEVERVGQALPNYPHIQSYVDWWRKRASLDAQGWQELVQARRQALVERVQNYSRTILNDGTMMAGLRAPPLEWGIGRWQVSNRLLAAVLPSTNEQFWGGWIAGRHRHGDLEAAVFTADRVLRPGDVGEYAELEAVIPVSGRRDRLGLLLLVSAANKDLFSNTLVPFRWAGYRFLALRGQERTLWEVDLGQVPERGHWFLVRLPRLPEEVTELRLQLRAEDRKLSMNNYTIAYVGPLRLLELPE